MNTQHLRYAIEVGKTGSITQAAENLYIGQPSLSKALKELEESLHIVIFKRTSRGAVPTEQGEKFLEHARAVLHQVELMEALHRDNQAETQRFHVSLSRVAYVRAAARRIVSAMDATGEMDVRIQRASALRAIQHVAEGVSELAVIRYPIRYERYFLDYMEERKLRSDAVWEGAPLLAMAKAHPLLERRSIEPDDLLDLPEVRYCDEVVPYLPEEEMEERVSNRVMRVSDTLALAGSLRAIRGAYGFCGDLEADEADRFGLSLRAWHADRHVRDAIVYPRGYAFREQGRQFIDAVYLCRNQLMYADKT